MKKRLFIILILTNFPMFVFSNEVGLLKASSEALALLSERESRPESLIERRNFDAAQFDRVRDEIKNNKTDAIAVLSNDAVDPSVKALIIRLAQTLDSTQYLDFLNELLEAAESSKVDVIYLDWALRPSEKHLRNIWYEEGNSIKRAALAERMRAFFDGDERYGDFFLAVSKNSVEQPPFGSGAYLNEKVDGEPPMRKSRSNSNLQPVNTDKSSIVSTKWLIFAGCLVAAGLGILVKIWKKLQSE